MRKQTARVELIEVLAPDDAALWADGEPIRELATDAAPLEPRSRRGLVVAAALAVAAIAGTIALSDDSNPESAISTTTAPTPTTQRALLDPNPTTHFLIDEPSLTPYSADIVTQPAAGEAVQVWTNGTAFGPLVIIELHAHPYHAYGISSATREVIEGVEMVRPIVDSETLISEVAIDDSYSATVRATHLNVAEVAGIISSVTVVGAQLVDDSEVMANLGLELTFEDESLESLLFGRVESTVRYLTDGGQMVTLHSAQGSSENRLAAFGVLTTEKQPVRYGSSHGRLPNGDNAVVWEDDGRLLSLVGPGDLDALLAIQGTVRAASSREWTTMVYGLRPDYTLGEFATLATGRATNGELWRAGPQITERSGRIEFLWWWTVPGFSDVTDSTPASLTAGRQPGYEAVVVPGATFIFVAQPDLGGTVTVRTADGSEYVSDLMQPFAQTSVYMTVVRVEAPGPIIVDIDGKVVPG